MAALKEGQSSTDQEKRSRLIIHLPLQHSLLMSQCGAPRDHAAVRDTVQEARKEGLGKSSQLSLLSACSVPGRVDTIVAVLLM